MIAGHEWSLRVVLVQWGCLLRDGPEPRGTPGLYRSEKQDGPTSLRTLESYCLGFFFLDRISRVLTLYSSNGTGQ